jgi:hypothetical protein
MKVTAETRVREALGMSETMVHAFELLSPEFARLRNPELRAVMARRATIGQAARIARVPLTEALFVLNLEAGEEVERLSRELRQMPLDTFDYHPEDAEERPPELQGLRDDDPRVRYLDLMPRAERLADPRPAILTALRKLRGPGDVLLIRYPFDPVPLRDLLARRGYLSWAETREPGAWYVYFYKAATYAALAAGSSPTVRAMSRAAGAGR